MLHLMEVKLQRSNFNPSCNLTHSVYSWNRVLIQRRGNQSYTLRKLGHFLTPFAVPNGKLSANHAFVSLPSQMLHARSRQPCTLKTKPVFGSSYHCKCENKWGIVPVLILKMGVYSAVELRSFWQLSIDVAEKSFILKNY